MGYDLTVKSGNVCLAEAVTLIRELLEFAAQMELEIIPVNWMITGVVPDHQGVLREIFGEKVDEAQLLVSRPVFKKTVEHGKKVLWYAINREHVQGLVVCHHYEEWILTWNVTRGGLLGRYYQISNAPTERFFDPLDASSPISLLSKVDEFVNSTPGEVHGEFAEDHLGIHCPWRRGDAAAACDVVKLLARHCDGLEASDDMGVWPNKDFTKWSSFVKKWNAISGFTPIHPDVADEL